MLTTKNTTMTRTPYLYISRLHSTDKAFARAFDILKVPVLSWTIASITKNTKHAFIAIFGSPIITPPDHREVKPF